jgi:molybdenum cofactor biosynthesis protein MoaC
VKLLQNQDELKELRLVKGPVFSTAITAGVLAVKQTSNILPFCHMIPIERCEIKIEFCSEQKNSIRIDCIVGTTYKTGVEMEALVGASSSALCIYDMIKSVTHDITISDIKLISKYGGKSDYNMSC